MSYIKWMNTFPFSLPSSSTKTAPQVIVPDHCANSGALYTQLFTKLLRETEAFSKAGKQFRHFNMNEIVLINVNDIFITSHLVVQSVFH